MLLRYGLLSRTSCIARSLRSTRPTSPLSISQTILKRTNSSVSSNSVPSFRQQVVNTSTHDSFKSKFSSGPSIRNQIAFVVTGSIAAYVVAAACTTVDTEMWAGELRKSSTVWANRDPSSDELRRAKSFVLGKKLQTWLNELKDSLNSTAIPAYFRYYIIRGYVDVAQPYLDTTEGRRLCWKISLFNTAVYLAWKLRRLEGPMTRGWMHNPLSGRSYTLLTSMFSHRGIFHLLFNCMALTSFGSAATRYLQNAQANGPSTVQESTATYHFLAFYVSAGLFSGLISHIAAARWLYPRMISRLSAPATSIQKPLHTASTSFASSLASTGTASAVVQSATSATSAASASTILPSLGASGAIYAAVMVTALGFPDAQIALVIPPSFPIPIQWGVGGMMMIDMIGILRGWRLFDHYAHLGGAAFGALYWKYGPRMWDSLREAYVEYEDEHNQ